MSVTEALLRCGGVATRSTLLAMTSRAQFDRAVRSGEVLRVGRGRYALVGADQARVTAHALAGALCLESAALHWGWPVKLPPDPPHVALPRNRKPAPTLSGAAQLHRMRLSRDDVVDGVTSRDRTLIDCLRLLPFDRALAVADSALREDYPARRMRALARDARGPGAQAIRRVAGLSDARAANPFESVLRAIALGVAGLRVEPQVTLRRQEGHGGSTVLGRPDLVDEELRIVLEADSFEWDGGREALRTDARRYNAFVVEGWLVLRFSWEDVVLQPARVAQTLRAAVAERTNRLCPTCRTAS